MVIGITMLKVLPGQEKRIYIALKSKEGILDIYHIFGEYDFFLILRAEGLDKLNQIIENLRDIHDVMVARTILISWDKNMQELNPLKPWQADIGGHHPPGPRMA
jgi:DNA-binding Lrp family transcriptional regulator